MWYRGSPPYQRPRWDFSFELWYDPKSGADESFNGHLQAVDFVLEDGDPRLSVDVGELSESPTSMYLPKRSRQNNCNNVHVSGTCFRSPQVVRDETVPDYYDVPVYQICDSSGNVVRSGVNVFRPLGTYAEIVAEKFVLDPTRDNVMHGIRIVHVCYHESQGIPYFLSGEWYCWFEIIDGKPVQSEQIVSVQTKAYWDEYPYRDTAYPDSFRYCYPRTWNNAYMHVDWQGNLLDVSHPSPYRYYGYPRENWDYYQIQTQAVPLLRAQNGSLDIGFSDIERDVDGAMVAGLDQVDLTTSNGMAFTNDVREMPRTISNDLSALRNLAKGSPGKLKIAAGLFLSVHYGYKLFAQDAIEFASVFKEMQKTHLPHIAVDVPCYPTTCCKGAVKLTSSSSHMNVYYDPYGQLSSSALKFAEAVDLVPDFSNVWDMIPFSFVVDWFTNIGELAEGVDALITLAQQHRVIGTIISDNENYSYQPDGVVGSYTYRIYRRRIMPGWFPLPRFSFQLKNPVTNLYHWLEGSALVVATRG